MLEEVRLARKSNLGGTALEQCLFANSGSEEIGLLLEVFGTTLEQHFVKWKKRKYNLFSIPLLVCLVIQVKKLQKIYCKNNFPIA